MQANVGQCIIGDHEHKKLALQLLSTSLQIWQGRFIETLPNYECILAGRGQTSGDSRKGQKGQNIFRKREISISKQGYNEAT